MSLRDGGSMMLSVHRAISRDKAFYPDDPDAFNPSRFLIASGELDASVKDPEQFVFGWGRYASDSGCPI
jgi:cytochrome P450